MSKQIINYSFIIPHHNSPELLQRCIDSIPQRDDIEIIIADDNSDIDKKANIKRADVEIITINRCESKGAGHARNIAMSKASGKWLCFADCDDFYKSNFISILDEYKDELFDVLFFNCDSVYSDTLELCHRTNRLNAQIANYDGSEETTAALKYRTHAPWRKMVLREYVEKNGFRFEAVPKGNDTLFSFLTSYFTDNFRVEKRVLYTCTLNKNSLTHSKHSLTFYKTSLCNLYKVNGFHSYIGHPEWNKKSIMVFLSCLKRGGIGMFLNLLYYYLSNYKEIHKGSCLYTDIIENIKKNQII